MPVPERKRKTAKAAAPSPQVPQAKSWELRITSFLEMRAAAIVALLLVAGAARTAATYHVLSITYDEPTHYSTGLEYLTDHGYRLETQHPPLERAMGALIPYLTGARSSPETRVAPQVPERQVARELLGKVMQAQFRPDSRTDELLARMRWGVLPFFLVAGLVVYEWTRYSLGKAAAVLATALFTLTPTVLAHAGLATTDIALTACLTAAFLALVRWVETPSPHRALVLGFWTALAVLSKFTALLYLPSAALLALVGFVAIARPGMSALAGLARARLATFALAVATGALVIWAGYWFSFGATPWSGGLRMPAPQLFDGLKAVLEHNQSGHNAYLLGQVSNSGFWYFFPVALAVKTPIAILLLAGLGLVLCWKRRLPRAWTAIAFAVGIVAPAMAGHINIGVRHILPIYASFAMLGALGWLELIKPARGRLGLLAAVVLVAWPACAGILQHPDYLSYFNELAGRRPELILADSDLDWGQSSKRASARLSELGATAVTMFCSDKIEFDQFTAQMYGFPPLKRFWPQGPNSGWTVISPTAVSAFGGGWQNSVTVMKDGQPVSVRPWYQLVEPTERVGSLLLYYFPPSGTPRNAQPIR
jgi:4-amino-4-deoxy-L-arabinose transferase-like glycosyltransferase